MQQWTIGTELYLVISRHNLYSVTYNVNSLLLGFKLITKFKGYNKAEDILLQF